MFNPVEYVKHNPVVGGLGVFVIGLGALYLLGFFKSAPADNGAGAYYAATVADAQSGNHLQETYVTAAAATAQAGIAADAYTHVQDTWAGTQLGINTSNNSTALALQSNQNATDLALAPYQTQQVLINNLGSVAGQTQTTSSGSSGFFGIGASQRTTVAPTPLATSAGSALSQLLRDMEAHTVH